MVTRQEAGAKAAEMEAAVAESQQSPDATAEEGPVEPSGSGGPEQGVTWDLVVTDEAGKNARQGGQI